MAVRAAALARGPRQSKKRNPRGPRKWVPKNASRLPGSDVSSGEGELHEWQLFDAGSDKSEGSDSEGCFEEQDGSALAGLEAKRCLSGTRLSSPTCRSWSSSCTGWTAARTCSGICWQATTWCAMGPFPDCSYIFSGVPHRLGCDLQPSQRSLWRHNSMQKGYHLETRARHWWWDVRASPKTMAFSRDWRRRVAGALS